MKASMCAQRAARLDLRQVLPRPMSQVRVAASSGGFPDPAIVFRCGVNWCSGEHVDGPPLPRKSCDQGEDEYSPRSNTCVHSHAKNEHLFRCGASTGHPKSWAPGFGMLTQVCQRSLIRICSCGVGTRASARNVYIIDTA